MTSGVDWRCYDCGSTEGFSLVTYETAYGLEYDGRCDQCRSTNTHEEGNGEPQCDCGNYDWFCSECSHFKCNVCWQWVSADIEPDEYVCKSCLEKQ